ncbi:MAG: transcriptional regulator [Planctomycetes bacterium GWF2_42_9]|nr:MAG: transcriptional regulator [Planctomycetes bacterium GWF2_42_9]HAL45777.1 transcriptional regulator [Phycisphaerales bacterium]
MARQKITGPTDKELEILNVLWKNGPATVRQVNRQVNEEINKIQKTGYTTTLKLMQIMTDKGLLVRDDSGFQHIYKPASSEENIQKQLVGSLLERAFSGSAEKLVMRALSAKKISVEELARIKNILEKFKNSHEDTKTQRK